MFEEEEDLNPLNMDQSFWQSGNLGSHNWWTCFFSIFTVRKERNVAGIRRELERDNIYKDNTRLKLSINKRLW